MRFSLLSALTIIGFSLAAPTEMVPRQSNPSVFFCKGMDFTGGCAVAPVTLNKCFNFPSSYSNQISSFQPSNGTACLLWSNQGCTGTTPGGFIVYPGSKDLGKYKYNDMANSVQCKAE
ncbi:hypothetical protein RhiJN_23527 [Ceratobasidium sp. AG-Ba]|nr:hypothetical protein RhiJN_23527 [Ceratobasidium sp. AG-Ba]